MANEYGMGNPVYKNVHNECLLKKKYKSCNNRKESILVEPLKQKV